MRIPTIGLGLSILAAAPVLAAEGNPIGGIGVSVENSGAGITVVQYDNETDARAACTEAGGTYGNAQGQITCKNPVKPLERKGRGIAAGRGGGAFTPVVPQAVATPTATATISGSEKTAAKPN